MLRIMAGKKKIKDVFRVKFSITGKLPNQSAEVTTLVAGRIPMVSRLPARNMAASTKGEGYLSATLPPR